MSTNPGNIWCDIKVLTESSSDGIQSSKSGRVIVKPCKQVEIDFYQSTLSHPEFRHFIPEFIGTLELNQPAEPKASHSRAPSQNLLVPGPDHGTTPSWTPSGGGKIAADHGLALENVAYGFKKPNILDVKLGRRLWADDAPPAKRQKLDKIAGETTSTPLGLRIAGMKTFVGFASPEADNIDGYRKYDKNYGRMFTVDTIRQAFEKYFFIESAGITKEMAHKVIKRFLVDLRALQQVLEAEESRMYSSSLLFVYEGDSHRLQRDLDTPTPAESFRDSDSDEAVDLSEDSSDEQTGTVVDLPGIPEGFTVIHQDLGSMPLAPGTKDSDDDEGEGRPMYKIQAVKMIDFAHATWVPGQGPDENTLFGFKSVIRILEEMIL